MDLIVRRPFYLFELAQPRPLAAAELRQQVAFLADCNLLKRQVLAPFLVQS